MRFLQLTGELQNWKEMYEHCLTFPESKWQVQFGFPVALSAIQPVYTGQLKKVMAQFSGVGAFLKMRPMTMYDWHTDTERRGVINIRLNEANSHSLFGSRTSFSKIRSVQEVPYGPPGSPLLFNTQVEHCVLNLDETRYMWSIDLRQRPSFAKVVEFLNSEDAK